MNIHLKIAAIILLAFCGLQAFPQQQGDVQLEYRSFAEMYNVVDTAEMNIIYAHSMFDPVLEKKEVVYELLSLGKDHSLYRMLAGYKSDSVSNSKAGEKYWFFGDDYKLYREYTNTYGTSRERILKSYSDSKLTFTGSVLGDTYLASEPLYDGMQWTMEEDAPRKILDHECRKASLKWRGREWTAWYSDIPYNDGPSKFGGLPGLILELTDSTGEHKIRAIGIKNDRYPFGLNSGNPFKTSRERYNKLLEGYISDFAGSLYQQGRVTGGLENERKKPRRLFYCPIELE